MSGALKMFFAVSSHGLGRNITVGTSGGGSPTFGFHLDPTGGSIVGAPYGALSNAALGANGNIATISGGSLGGANDLRVVVWRNGATITQNFFTSIKIKDGSNVIRTYTTAAAAVFTRSTHTTINDIGLWSWGDGSNLVYSSGDLGKITGVDFT